MADLDFTGDFPYADAEGTLVLSPDALYWDDITTLVQDPSRLTMHREPRRRGNYSLLIDCHDDDISSGPSERTELFVNSAGRNLYGNGDEIWWGTSVWLPADFPTLTSWFLISQMHGTESGSPQWAVELTGEQIQHTVRGGNIAAGGDQDWPRADTYTAQVGLPRETWIDIRCYTKLSTGSDGINQMWVREAGDAWPTSPQVDVTGVNVISIASTPLTLPAPRCSIYRDHRTDSTAYYTIGNAIRRSSDALDAALFTDQYDLSSVILADSPVGYWDLHESSGTFASQGSNTGALTATGSPTRAVTSLTRDGQGAAVTLGSGVYLTGPDLSLGEGTAMTMEALVNVGTNGSRAVVSEGNSSDADSRNEMAINFTSLVVERTNDAGTAITASPSASGTRQAVASRTHHILWRWSQTLGLHELYVNGERQNSTAFAPSGAITLNNLLIGGKNANGTISKTGGAITLQHVAVYDKWLTDDRVQARWNAATRDALTVAPVGPTPRSNLVKSLALVGGTAAWLA